MPDEPPSFFDFEFLDMAFAGGAGNLQSVVYPCPTCCVTLTDDAGNAEDEGRYLFLLIGSKHQSKKTIEESKKRGQIRETKNAEAFIAQRLPVM